MGYSENIFDEIDIQNSKFKQIQRISTMFNSNDSHQKALESKRMLEKMLSIRKSNPISVSSLEDE